MTKNKKILISIAILLVLTASVYFVYGIFFNSSKQYAEIEQQGLNNISGAVKAIEGNNLRVLAQVPDEYTPYTKGGYEYVNKNYVLKTSPSTQMLLFIKDNNFNQLFDLSSIKPGDNFTAVSKENIMNKNELEIVEIIFYK